MPAVTDSSSKLTYFANCVTIGLLEITYPAGHPMGRREYAEAVLTRADESSGFHGILGRRLVPAHRETMGQLQNRNFSTELSDVESYSEPAILWRLRHPKGDRARATLIPGSPESTLVFFLNDRLDRGENFTEWAQAMARAEAVRQELLEQGWKIEG